MRFLTFIKNTIRELFSKRTVKNICGSCQYWRTSDCIRDKKHIVAMYDLKCDHFRIGIGYTKNN